MPIVPAPIQQPQIVTPTSPPTGSLKLYPKADGNFYKLDSAGVEVALGGAGGTQAADTEEFLPAAAATTVTLARPPSKILMVTRDGLAQSSVDGHYSVAGSLLTFTDAFNGAERVAVTYAFGTIYAAGPMGPSASVHEEFMPANNATTLTLSQACQALLLVARNGVIQSATSGNYSIAGNLVTFTDAFNGSERVVVEYAQSTVTATPPFNGSGLVDASVNNTKLAGYPWGNADLKADVARANLFTNGGFEVWQRGNGPFTAHNIYTADRWLMLVPGAGGSLSVTRDTTNVDAGSEVAAALVATYAGQEGFLFQTPENYKQLRGRTITLSARVKTSNASAIRLWLDGEAARKYGTTHSGNGTWQTLTLTVTVVPAGVPTGGFNIVGSGTFYVDNVTLVVGSVAADYTPMHPTDEMARCQRYYEVVGVPGSGDVCVTGYGTAGQNWHWQMVWKVQKAVTPTATKVGTWVTSPSAGQPAISVPTVYGAQVYFPITQTIASSSIAYNAATDCCFIIEANP